MSSHATQHWKAKRQEKNTHSDIRKLADILMGNTAILEKYPEDFNQQFDNLPKDSEEEWT